MMSGLPLGKRYRAMVNAATWPLTYRECTRAHSHVHSRERIKCRELKTRARVKANLYESFLMTPACAQARRTEERPRARLIASYRLTIKRTCFGPASLFLWLLGASENLSISIFASAFAPSSSPPLLLALHARKINRRTPIRCGARRRKIKDFFRSMMIAAIDNHRKFASRELALTRVVSLRRKRRVESTRPLRCRERGGRAPRAKQQERKDLSGARATRGPSPLAPRPVAPSLSVLPPSRVRSVAHFVCHTRGTRTP